ncbi:hypothetical protein GO009_12130 [Muricauda sp. TY007]|uniref:hypothetical protein n=1 Tax=Allomuricauda sp. TY007 TaxID=2683200 RepID=UPI0013C1B9C1|nr:hypothetical protein [Muricauda sp. TY007]NDV16775.1 hypothetical protein [Muricauda sp. TY007]
MDDLVLEMPSYDTTLEYRSSGLNIHSEQQTTTANYFPSLEKKEWREQVVWNYWTESKHKAGEVDNIKTQKLIDLKKVYSNQINFLRSELDETIDERLIQSYFENILTKILQLSPDDVGFELSYDQSLIFSLIKNDSKTYLEITPSEDEFEEAMLTSIDENGNMNSVIGSINDMIEKLEYKFEGFHQTYFIPVF